MNRVEVKGGLDFDTELKSNISSTSEVDWSQLIRERQINQPGNEVGEHQSAKRKWGIAFRMVAAFILPVLTFAGFCGSKVCLLILGDIIKTEMDGDDITLPAQSYSWLVVGVSGSYALCLTLNLLIASSREKTHPSIPLLIWGVITGVVESFGVSLLTYFMVPKADPAISLAVLCTLTAFCRFNIMQEEKKGQMVISFAARCMMVACLVALLFLSKTTTFYYIIPTALICSSAPYWTTKYLTSKKKEHSYWMAFYKHVGTTVGSFGFGIGIWAFYFGETDQLFNYGFARMTSSYWSDSCWAGVFFTVGTALGYIMGWWCCSVRFQRIGFALPLALCSPFSYLFFGLYLYFTSGAIDTASMAWTVPLFMCIWLGQCWLTRFSWNENVFPGALCNALWYQPSAFCAVTLEQIMLINRRPNTLKLSRVMNKETGMPDTMSMCSSELGILDAVSGNPLVFICTTMWHENEPEMESVVNSYYRMDKFTYNDNTQFEIHIIFDNSINEDGCWNEYVELFTQFLPAFNKEENLLLTPYGYQMRYVLPYGTPITVHLKNKRIIKIKKRWSQIMYMFYVLRYRTYCDNLDPDNTYILATDGDVDFDVNGIHDLVIHLQRNSIVGGVCSRVHPMGKGVLAWFQIFEYALGQWFLKCAEEVFGSVLCLPGVFSLYRCSAVECCMYAYALETDSASNFLKYDQGEDRWFSTLMVMNGWLLQYSAAADAYTYCPEAFDEFFNQRRRWITSTFANTIEIVKRTKQLVRNNTNISYFFIVYQTILLISSFCAPMVVVFLVTAGLNFGFGVDPILVVGFSATFIFLYGIMTLICQVDVQLFISKVSTVLTAVLMVFVTVGFIQPLVEDPDSFESIILITTSMFIIVGAVLHPRELVAIPCGITFVLLIPMGYILLMFYSVGNINSVSWGTRDSGAKTGDSVLTRLLNKLKFWKPITKWWKGRYSNKKDTKESAESESEMELKMPLISELSDGDLKKMASRGNFSIDALDIDQEDNKSFDFSECKLISLEEENFWKQMLKAVLRAKEKNEVQAEKDKELLRALTSLRNKCMAALLCLQLGLCVIFLALHNRVELYVFGMPFFSLVQMSFTTLIVGQFACLLWHRWKTAMHIIGIAGWKKVEVSVDAEKTTLL